MPSKIIINDDYQIMNDYYADSESFVISKSIANGINNILKKSKEESNFYILLGNSLVDNSIVDEFSVSLNLESIDRYSSIYNILAKFKKTAAYQDLEQKEKQSIGNLQKYARENYNRIVYGRSEVYSYEDLPAEKQKKGIMLVFEKIGAAIKKIILAVAAFFKGIFVKMRSFFRNFDNKRLQKYWPVFKQVYGVTHAKDKYKLINMGPDFINPEMIEFLKKIPSTNGKIMQEIDKLIGTIREYGDKNKANIFDKAKFGWSLKTQGDSLYKITQELSMLGVKCETPEKNKIVFKIDMSDQINEIFFGSPDPKDVDLTGVQLVQKIEKSGILNNNFDALLLGISNSMSQLQSKLVANQNTYNRLKAGMNEAKGLNLALFKFVSMSFQKSLSVCRIMLRFYRLSSGTMYRVYRNVVNLIVRMAKERSNGTDLKAVRGNKKNELSDIV